MDFKLKEIDRKEVGGRIRALMKEAGLSTGELADILCVSPQAVNKWLTGRNLPDLQRIADLSQLFLVSIDYIIFGKTAVRDWDEIPFDCLETDTNTGTVYEISVRRGSSARMARRLRAYYFGLRKIQTVA